MAYYSNSLHEVPCTGPTETSLRMVTCYCTDLKSNIFLPVFVTCDLDCSLMRFKVQQIKTTVTQGVKVNATELWTSVTFNDF